MVPIPAPDFFEIQWIPDVANVIEKLAAVFGIHQQMDEHPGLTIGQGRSLPQYLTP